LKREEGAFSRGVGLLADQLRTLLNLKRGAACLWPPPATAILLLTTLARKTAAIRGEHATTWLISLPEHFGSFRRVSVMEDGS
jgi:hypothetical protein